MEHVFKLFEFNIFNKIDEDESSDDESGFNLKKDTCHFGIQMFGINKEGKRASIIVEDYQPFFYLKVDNSWGQTQKNALFNELKTKVGQYYRDSITSCKLIEKKKLYGFDAGKKHRFIEIKFANINIFNKVKNFWYTDDSYSERVLKPDGYVFNHNGKSTHIKLYESNIPPLLRFFHIREISPSGWVALPINKTTNILTKKTSCDVEYSISYKHIIPLNTNEDSVPYKIMSFDIEASSSHGDFPVPVKSYKKLATNIVDYFSKNEKITSNSCNKILTQIISSAFGFSKMDDIDLVYPIHPIQNEEELIERTNKFLVDRVLNVKDSDERVIELMFETTNNKMATENNKDELSDDESDTEEVNNHEEANNWKQKSIASKNSGNVKKKIDTTITDIILDKTIVRDDKINELIKSLTARFPMLEGDKVTFIGSSFMINGEKTPYLNHCIVLNSCDKLNVENSKIETYSTEKEVLLAWTKLVREENPDIIIGYNIFGFDYEFMFRRSQSLFCTEEFLKLSRNNEEVCATTNYKTGNLDIDRSSTTLASGTYELSIIKMNGRLQVDMLSWFRKTENLTSYKLDYVGSRFIGDDVKNIIHKKSDKIPDCSVTRIITNNMTGLQEDSYIHFEEINHSSDYYKEGKKFKVSNVCLKERWFEIIGTENPSGKKVKWGLAKDDVTPKDIFRMTNEGSKSRAIIAKYCIQDCNLVQYLFNKVDVLTDIVEMSKLCSVPMSFLIFRGQGIKLTSYVAKKCKENGVLMPVINKGLIDEAYEGAIVLEPKCKLYLEDPVVIGDFASLYPSCILSENLCPSSKVFTKNYDLSGNLISETGEKNKKNQYEFDNLPEYEYVDIKFDTFKWIKKKPNGSFEKVNVGYKLCRFAQPRIINGKEESAIMPSILKELLTARKDTRKLIPKTTDEFMKNVLDKRQLAYKVTANSLYGQLGAKTSTFYEPDIAASTTATGRLLLTFAKKIVEECYNDTNIETKYGMVNTKTEYVYGDTDSVFFKFNLTDSKTGEKIIGEKALEISIDIAQDACKTVSKVLKKPHDFEYEKTFMPFCLLSKKRYVAIKYEYDTSKGKRNEMGIVLKRRDNAPIVKDVYGGVIDILMNEKNISKAVNFVHNCLKELVNGSVPIEKLIITKSLRSFYKNPQSIAHKVLADRIGQREPGNKPTSGDRIPYVYINKKTVKGVKMLQGDKIETPSFIKEHNLKIDYSFYITNQLMKPLSQLFGLILTDLWLSQKPARRGKVQKFNNEIQMIHNNEDNEKKIETKINKLKDKEVKELIFSSYLRETDNVKNGNQNISSFFTKNKFIKISND